MTPEPIANTKLRQTDSLDHGETRVALENSISTDKVAELAIDLWRLTCRARDDESGHRVLTACERMEDRLRTLGFEIVNPVGQPYDSDMKFEIIEHVGHKEPFRIVDCTSPAIYFKGVLIREAHIVLEGE